MRNKKITLSYQDWIYFNYWWASHDELKLEEALDLFKKEKMKTKEQVENLKEEK